MNKLKFFLERFRWLKILNSPFKPFKVKVYVGKIAVGIPYFFPRKWVKYNEQDIQLAIEKHKANKNFVLVTDTQLYDMYKNYRKAVPLKVGFSYCSLGWKTKWSDTDYRFEWNPVLSFVFFGYQIALQVYQYNPDQYWEAWLYYEYVTDKTKSKRERIQQCRKECPQTYTGDVWSVDYYEKILKPKYLK